jgi:hypothetical protein
MSVCGASLVAAIVVMFCAAWTLEEAFSGQLRREDEHAARAMIWTWTGVVQRLRERPAFYLVCLFSCVVGGAFTVYTGGDNSSTVVQLSVGVQFINGILMPPIVWALWYMCSFRLPECPLEGARRNVTGVAFLVCSLFCLATAFMAL